MQQIDRHSYLSFLEQEHQSFKKIMTGIRYQLAEGRCRNRIFTEAAEELFHLGVPRCDLGNIVRLMKLFVFEKSHHGSGC